MNWPWMGVMFVWNMDYSTVPWNDYCDQKSWFAILNYDGTPRPAYLQLAQMVREQATPTATNTPLRPTSTSTATNTPMVPTPTATRTPAWATSTPTASATPQIGLNTGSVVGRVMLQGRSNHQGATISVSGRSAITSADGSFTIESVPAGTRELCAQMAGYLPYSLSGLIVYAGRVVVLSDIVLYAGDINGDGLVNLFDLVAVSIRYGTQASSSTPEDVNGDGNVNLFDLVLVSTNYGK